MVKGMRGHAALLGAVLRRDKTANDIAEEVGAVPRTIRPTLRQMVQVGLIHVSAFDSSKPGTPQAVFRFGPGENAPMPPSKRHGRPSTSHWSKDIKAKVRPEMIAFKSICEAMESGSTKAEIISETGVQWSTLAMLMRDMKRLNLIHVCGWISASEGYPAAVYQFGPGRDVKRPKPECKRERALRYYRAKKAAQRALKVAAAIAPELEVA